MSIDKLKTKFFTGAWLTDVKHYFKKINEIIDYLNGNGTPGDGSYKEYVALLEQTGLNAPTATVLSNTLGTTITYSYNGVGDFGGQGNSGTLPAAKTTFYIGNAYQNNYNTISHSGSDSFNINSYDTSNAGQNEKISVTTIIIRVYN